MKTGCTIAYGGAVEAFGVVPDIVCLAKAIGGGLPCGAIGATEELFRRVIDGGHDIAGTFNGNPLTLAAKQEPRSRRCSPRRHTQTFDRIDGVPEGAACRR